MILDFTLLKGDYSIYQLNNNSEIPDWIYDSDFYSITRTHEELSIVSKDFDIITDDIRVDRHWVILKVNGPLDLSLIGIIAYTSNLLKKNNISIFTISTFNTDYVLIKDQYVDEALMVLNKVGHKVFYES
jgi:hypothetical protein